MATPMNVQGLCGLCWDSDDGGTFDVDEKTRKLLLVNVCFSCRFWENTQLILLRSVFTGNGHPESCVCLECTGDL